MSNVDSVNLHLPSPITEIHDALLTTQGIRLFLKRDDLIHPDLNGNKWRKLKYNLEAARLESATTLLTFGGAYSNHIRAVASAGHHFGFKTIGIIRGEEHAELNSSLAYARDHGMLLSYLDRTTYRRKSAARVVDRLRAEFGNFYLLPEGGSNTLALRGCAEATQEIDLDFDVICCSCGTGGTLAGIAGPLRKDQRALGFAVLKGAEFLNEDVSGFQVAAWGSATSNWSIETGFHFGGYAKKNGVLEEFISLFSAQHGVLLE
ncbi:1-aminocyclopropane-1-carboxylate deaminase/D-cysteine desulfhydrase [Amycolatopsis sp. H20-H5]|uniref:1-aminocyclopropane-1-carboxylate deaminase/D-cysteine desulfhydrase n=1 Tax=Amycolatopsis sp. H20-H5 TaxID=3046309 RepID=UPI002DB72F7B|nr:pyridoxal-phosphate dependent enzyme [Amycolatopsis sp. H20-H5]MEC3977629.1 pyridoxal-phosphate dependent enzyme [Amycolatopsis sp. H20-H5]